MTTTLRPAPASASRAGWYAICANGAPVGRIRIRPQGRWGPGIGWIDQVEVAPPRRRRGHGCVAMLAAEEILRARGCQQVVAEVPDGSAEGERLASSLGYRRDSVELAGRVPRWPAGFATPPREDPAFAPMSAADYQPWRAAAVREYTTRSTAAGWSPRGAASRAEFLLPDNAEGVHVLYTATGAVAGVLRVDTDDRDPTLTGRATNTALDVPVLWVPAEQRGRGWGALLVHHAVRLARAGGHRELRVVTPDTTHGQWRGAKLGVRSRLLTKPVL